MDKRLEELISWMFFNSCIIEATEIMSALMTQHQRDQTIVLLEALKKKKEDEKNRTSD